MVDCSGRRFTKCELTRHEVAKCEIVKRSKYWPMVIAKGHIGKGE
jgi:hypothetical protein